MKKENCKTTILKKGTISEYNFDTIKLYAYKTNDLIDDEVFILVKDGRGICIELPCFYDNIKELSDFIKENNIQLVGKMVAYHAAGASFMPEIPAYGTKSSSEYNSVGGGANLIRNFASAFGDTFDSSICTTELIEDGEFELAGIKLNIISNSESYDIEIPEINCVYTHMLGHDCHSIVAGCPHADGIISQLNYYIRKGFELVLTSHYTPEDLKDVRTKIDYLNTLKDIALGCDDAESMKKKVKEKYPEYSGLNYLDMTVNFFFPAE